MTVSGDGNEQPISTRTPDGSGGSDGSDADLVASKSNEPLVPSEPSGAGKNIGQVNPLLTDSTDLDLIASASYAQLVEAEKVCLKFKDDFDYTAYNIGAALTYIIDLLPPKAHIFYIGFRGTKGAGKTTAIDYAVEITNHGIKLDCTTFAALAAECQDEHTVCIDEADAQIDRCQDLEAFLRIGISLNAKYNKMVPLGKEWKKCSVDARGMKFLAWKDHLDEALMQRCIVIEMAPGASTRMVINDENLGRYTTPVKVWFSAQSARVHETWNAERVAVLYRDDDHHIEQMVDAMATIVPRQRQKAILMLRVCEIYGWDFQEAVRSLVDRQPEGEDYSDYKELVTEIFWQHRELLDKRGEQDKPVILSLVEFKQDLTERITQKRLDPLRLRGKPGTLTWTGLRQECGFLPGINERKLTLRGGKRILEFDERVQKALGLLNSQTTLGGQI